MQRHYVISIMYVRRYIYATILLLYTERKVYNILYVICIYRTVRSIMIRRDYDIICM